MSGHTHYHRNEPSVSNSSVYEHVHAAVCGTWWYSRVNGDGCPNGYGVYDITGNTIKNWYYKGVNVNVSITLSIITFFDSCFLAIFILLPIR